jgi:hypothetical protein
VAYRTGLAEERVREDVNILVTSSVIDAFGSDPVAFPYQEIRIVIPPPGPACMGSNCPSGDRPSEYPMGRKKPSCRGADGGKTWQSDRAGVVAAGFPASRVRTRSLVRAPSIAIGARIGQTAQGRRRETETLQVLLSGHHADPRM